MGLILKDKAGNAVDRGNANHISVPYVNADGNKSDYVFTNMNHLYCYYATQNNVSEGVYTYTITGRWFMVAEPGYAIANASGGEEATLVILTTKPLTIGETYYPSELGGV